MAQQIDAQARIKLILGSHIIDNELLKDQLVAKDAKIAELQAQLGALTAPKAAASATLPKV
jgi:hypothetical protein